MGFAAEERASLLALRGVGATVISRLEQIGFCELRELADADARDITAALAALTGSTCWRNSPQARAAIEAIIALAGSRG